MRSGGVSIRRAVDPGDIARCHAVMAELRPHVGAEELVSRVQRQVREAGYRMAFAEAGGTIRSVAGYRISECLAWGRFLYVDDLVTRAEDHGGGFGSALFDWLVDEARRERCDQFHLDSGVQRFGAHRFYLGKGMDITSHHFAMRLGVPPDG